VICFIVSMCILYLAGDDQPPTLTAGEGTKCFGKATKMSPPEKVKYSTLVIHFVIVPWFSGDLQTSHM